MLGGDVVDELLDEHRLAHPGAAEEADLTAPGIGGEQVDDLDARLHDLGGGALLGKGGGRPVDGPGLLGLYRALLVDGLAQDVEHPAQGLLPHRGLDGGAGGDHLVPPAQPLAGGEHDAPDGVPAHVLGHFHHPRLAVHGDGHGLVDLRQLAAGELHVHHRPKHLRHSAFQFHFASSLSMGGCRPPGNGRSGPVSPPGGAGALAPLAGRRPPPR